jgi:hypothetical protein
MRLAKPENALHLPRASNGAEGTKTPLPRQVGCRQHQPLRQVSQKLVLGVFVHFIANSCVIFSCAVWLTLARTLFRCRAVGMGLRLAFAFFFTAASIPSTQANYPLAS